MKKVIPVLFVLCTALVITAGFLLPGFVFSAQDSKLQKTTHTYETKGLQFHPVAQVSDSLRLVAGKSTMIDLSRNKRPNARRVPTAALSGECRLSADGAYKAALEALRFLKKEGTVGIEPEGYPIHRESAELAISEDQSTSAVLWECELRNDKAAQLVEMLIDDRSGKMLSIDVVSNTNPLAPNGEKSPQKLANDFFVRLATIFSDYYGLQCKTVQLGPAQLDHEFSRLNGLPDCYYTVRGSAILEEKSGKTLTLPLETYCGTYLFNDYVHMFGY